MPIFARLRMKSTNLRRGDGHIAEVVSVTHITIISTPVYSHLRQQPAKDMWKMIEGKMELATLSGVGRTEEIADMNNIVTCITDYRQGLDW
jgi:hypothetical protein